MTSHHTESSFKFFLSPEAKQDLETILNDLEKETSSHPCWLQLLEKYDCLETGCLWKIEEQPNEKGEYSVWVHTDESVQLEVVGEILHYLVVQYKLTPITFEFAYVCSTPRLNAFGGGVVVAHQNGLRIADTGMIESILLHELDNTQGIETVISQ